MSDWSPPTLPREWRVGICLFYVILFGYSLIIAQRLLFGILIGVLVGLVYVSWRFLRTIEAIADALQRIAHQREQDG